MSDKIYVGVDLGGTTIKVGVCDSEGKLVHTYEAPTKAEEGAEAGMERIAQYVRTAVAESPYEWEQVAGVGAGMAGFLDIPNGFIKFSNNLDWRNVRPSKSWRRSWAFRSRSTMTPMWLRWARLGAEQDGASTIACAIRWGQV